MTWTAGTAGALREGVRAVLLAAVVVALVVVAIFAPVYAVALAAIIFFVNRLVDAGERRKVCPDCAERVLSAANVCRFCGYRFAGERARAGDARS